MGRRSAVTIAGLADLRRRLDEVPEDISEGAHDAVAEGAEAVREQVRDNVRVHTGAARRGVRVRWKGPLTADVGWFDPELYYVRILEFGTSSIPADPVLTLAAELERREFPSRVTEDVRRELGNG